MSEGQRIFWQGFPDETDVAEWPGPFQEVGDQIAGEALRRGMTNLQACICGAVASFGPDGTDLTEEDLAKCIRIPALVKAAWVAPRRKRDARKGKR